MKITDAIHEFILYKQSLGMTYKNRALKLTAFARLAGPVEIDGISPETVRRFLDADRPVTAEWFNKFSALKMFFRFALSRGYATRNPLPLSQPKSPRQFRPYIYSMEEVQKMIRVVDNRYRGNWHLEPYTIRTLILLLYGTGLRIGEAIRLQHQDVGLNDAILTVRETKFYKTRLVPVSSDLTGVLRGYFERKWKGSGSSTATPFLATYDGRPVTHLTAELAFKRIRYEAGVKRTDTGLKTDTYNAAISRAVSALLAADSVNKERLAGDGLAEQLTDSVMRLIEREWTLLGSDERAGEALKKLRTAYEVVTAELTPYHHPEYGTATYKGEPEEMNLHASMRKDTFPPNVTYALVLRYANGKVEGVDDFLQSADKYEKLALSVPWLNKYIDDNPRVAFRISYVHNQSLGDKAMRVFTADMKLRGREDLIEQVKTQQADIVLLIVGNTYSESYWLLFPDKRMMLWRCGGASGLLKWTRNEFGKGQCSEYENNYGGCSAREVTPDGTLATAPVPQDQVCRGKSQSAPNWSRK